jgi:nucleotide-binding universal stress UspA family protein
VERRLLLRYRAFKEEKMLKKILVAMDGSENAERALWWVEKYAAREKAQVVLFRAVDPAEFDPEFLSSSLAEARDYLLRMEKEINYAGLPCKTVVRQGSPAKEIVKAALDERCDLILMTTRGGSKVKRWAIGGVTEKVLRMSPIPVLPVQSRTHAARNDHLRRIVVPVDGSKLAEAATEWAVKLAKMMKSQLAFVHVYPTGPKGRGKQVEDNFDALRERMVRFCQLLKKQGVRATFRVRTGDAADRILGFAGRNDLILTTTHGHGGFKRWVFGSVAEKLIHEAQVPVLVFKTMTQVDAKVLRAS